MFNILLQSKKRKGRRSLDIALPPSRSGWYDRPRCYSTLTLRRCRPVSFLKALRIIISLVLLVLVPNFKRGNLIYLDFSFSLCFPPPSYILLPTPHSPSIFLSGVLGGFFSLHFAPLPLLPAWSQSLALSRQADSDPGFGLPRPCHAHLLRVGRTRAIGTRMASLVLARE